jgi:predicted transcriptional regulator
MTEKFYQVTGPAGKPVYQYNVTDFEKAERVAKKAVADGHEDVYILTSTHIVVAPTPDLVTTPL